MTGPDQHATSAPPDKSESFLGAGVRIVGDLNAEGSVRIEGSIEGTVDAKRLVEVKPGGEVHGALRADSAIIGGMVTGHVHARKVAILKSAHVKADIWHEVLTIEAGADALGHFQRRKAPSEGTRTS